MAILTNPQCRVLIQSWKVEFRNSKQIQNSQAITFLQEKHPQKEITQSHKKNRSQNRTGNLTWILKRIKILAWWLLVQKTRVRTQCEKNLGIRWKDTFLWTKIKRIRNQRETIILWQSSQKNHLPGIWHWSNTTH